jgi:GNAT superfamily N-acetyltransferase
MPNMNEAVAAFGGRLLPWGWWRLLRGRARARSARVFLMGIRPSARRLGLPARFLGALRDVLERSRIDELEFSWVLPENVELVAMLERFGVRRAQVLRLYRKNLGD